MQHNCGLWCMCETWIIYLQDDCFLHDLCSVILIIYHVYCHCMVFYFENKLDSLFVNRFAAALTRLFTIESQILDGITADYPPAAVASGASGGDVGFNFNFPRGLDFSPNIFQRSQLL